MSPKFRGAWEMKLQINGIKIEFEEKFHTNTYQHVMERQGTKYPWVTPNKMGPTTYRSCQQCTINRGAVAAFGTRGIGTRVHYVPIPKV